MSAAEQPIAGIGHNGAPPDDEPTPPTPFDLAQKAVEDAYAETLLWLDGHAIDSQAMADGVGNLLAVIRKAHDLADETRKAENKPFDDGKAEVQRRYAPLIADTKAMKGKTILAMEACKRALQPWLDAEDKRIEEGRRRAREEADRIAREAQDAIRAADHTNLEEREAAETLLRQAKKAEKVASIADRQTAKAGGAMGRAASLRTVHVAVVTDLRAFAGWVWKARQPEIAEFLRGLANRLVHEGKRDLPGVEVREERKAV